jgi:putative spermidine/putrescine transport system ATP-binding protein
VPDLRGCDKTSARLQREIAGINPAPSERTADGAFDAIATPGTPRIKLDARGLSKTYGGTVALEPLDLTVHAGELLTLLGPSGSGKTTLLQIICGLVEPTTGALLIDGRDQTHAPAHQRDMGVVFQSYALFPHLTVEENVAFPLQMRKLPHGELRKKVAAALEMVGLVDLRGRFPGQLSGGQQQRVALARCFVYEPALILMDEPLGALDRKLRETMQIEIRRLHRDTGATIIFVTHDQEEALALSDRICLLNNARIEQIGSPREIYERPQTLFAADFIGISNVLRGRVGAGGQLQTPDGALPIPGESSSANAVAGQDGALVIRPELVEIVAPGSALVSGRVTESVYAGSETRLIVAMRSGAQLIVRHLSGQSPVGIGDVVGIRWDTEKARFLPATG